MTPQDVQCCGDTLQVRGPQGDVRLERRRGRIRARYEGGELLNESAEVYADALLEQAMAMTERFPFPWTVGEDGRLCITDHPRFYAQTFKAELRGIETLKRWLTPN